MANTKSEKTGQKPTNVHELSAAVKRLDDDFKKSIETVDWVLFEKMLNECDFTKTQSALDSMKVFYEFMWIHLLAPWKDELNSKDREVGRLILEWDKERRAKEKAQSELESLRKDIQEEGPEPPPSA